MGKLAVPEYILNKPGPLTAAEFEKMKLHASVGADILSAIDFPYPVVPIVRHHHESWNGTGYPDGLAGADIPIGARILSVVDCFDALTSDRPYRPRLSDKESIAILVERRGSMYDPLIVDTFIRVHAEIAPPASEFVEKTPLRAITAAAIEAGGASTSLGLDEIAASSEEMLTLFDLARGLSSPMSVSDAGDVIAKHLRRLIPCSLCVFYLYDVEADELVAAHSSGENASLVAGLRVGVGQRLSGWVAAHRQTIRNSDPVLDFGDATRALPSRLRSCLATPMTAESTLVGVLSLYATARDAFTEEHQRVLEVVSKQVSAIMKGATQFERSVSTSMRDAQTGLPNRERLTQLTQPENGIEGTFVSSIRARDSRESAEVCRRFERQRRDASHCCRKRAQSSRSADLLFRSGEQELVALLLKADRHSSSVIAGRLQDALQGVASENASGRQAEISVVVSALHHDASSIDRFLKESAAQTQPSAEPVVSITVPGGSQSVH